MLRSHGAQDLAIKEPTESPSPTPSPSQSGPKIVERVGGTSAGTETPATPAPTTSPSTTPTPQASQPATPASSPAATPAPAAATPTPARAAMLVATPQDAQKPAVSLGAAIWSVAPAPPGQPGAGGVKAEVDIPDLKMHASMVLRKNVDPSLPASHTIDLRLTFDEGSPIKGVKDIGVPQMRRDEPPSVTPLAGVRVMINESYFLIGLNRTDADIQRNVEAIASNGWFDFPMLLNDGRIAKLTFEKAAEGDKIIADALASWK